ncbi:MAG: NAD-dependent epimerase/dehydratase family protein [Bacteroidales bacterium]|nr:NAD-dependent epimerase/dehydratase family protein [Bacteroidales bacterium]MBN2758464.1 NAD-dependent epimerase/dehydratase family protein [Bacteroidales bacterium]
MKKTAVIFGSTGLIGKNLLFQLIDDERYSKIFVFNRKHLNINISKVEEIIVTDFENIDEFTFKQTPDEIYCCIGTTINKAKTKTAFTFVDYQIPVKIAKLAENKNISKLLIVSSIGANEKSNNFYLQTKGKMEQAVVKFSIESVHFFRPSMLLGKRNETRIAEGIGQIFMKIFGFLLIGKIKKYKAIKAETVAKAMINVANLNTGLNTKKDFIESDKIFELAK